MVLFLFQILYNYINAALMFSLYGFSWSNEYSYDFNKRIVLSLTNFICLYIDMSQTHKTRYMELI